MTATLSRTDLAAVAFVPGYDDNETVLELTVSRDVAVRVYRAISSWVADAFEATAGRYCPMMGDVESPEHAWAILPEGPVSVDLARGVVSLSFAHAPEGIDRLDGSHPDWFRGNPDRLWLEAVPRVRAILAA